MKIRWIFSEILVFYSSFLFFYFCTNESTPSCLVFDYTNHPLVFVPPFLSPYLYYILPSHPLHKRLLWQTKYVETESLGTRTKSTSFYFIGFSPSYTHPTSLRCLETRRQSLGHPPLLVCRRPTTNETSPLSGVPREGIVGFDFDPTFHPVSYTIKKPQQTELIPSILVFPRQGALKEMNQETDLSHPRRPRELRNK